MSTSIPHTSGIYKITCIPTGKVYVGSAVNLYQRWSNHRGTLRRNNHRNQYLQHAWNKHGETYFSFEVIELVLQPFLLEREQLYIDRFKSSNQRFGFNINATAGSPRGKPCLPETRAKISKALTGRKRPEATVWMKGTKSRLGKPHTPDTIAKMRDKKRGQKPTAETIAASIRKHAKAYVITSPEGIEYHITNLNQFCRDHGLSDSGMYNVACGLSKRYKGWTCRYK